MCFKTEVHESLARLLKVKSLAGSIKTDETKIATAAKSEITSETLKASWKQEDRSSGDYDKTESNFC